MMKAIQRTPMLTRRRGSTLVTSSAQIGAAMMARTPLKPVTMF